jgi:hypothetical protein
MRQALFVLLILALLALACSNGGQTLNCTWHATSCGNGLWDTCTNSGGSGIGCPPCQSGHYCTCSSVCDWK